MESSPLENRTSNNSHHLQLHEDCGRGNNQMMILLKIGASGWTWDVLNEAWRNTAWQEHLSKTDDPKPFINKDMLNVGYLGKKKSVTAEKNSRNAPSNILGVKCSEVCRAAFFPASRLAPWKSLERAFWTKHFIRATCLPMLLFNFFPFTSTPGLPLSAFKVVFSFFIQNETYVWYSLNTHIFLPFKTDILCLSGFFLTTHSISKLLSTFVSKAHSFLHLWIQVSCCYSSSRNVKTLHFKTMQGEKLHIFPCWIREKTMREL